MVCTPCVTTGELLKWNVICFVSALMTKLFAEIPFTVKSVAWTVLGFTGSLRLKTKSVGCVFITLLHAGTVRSQPKPTSSLSVKASCWEGR